MYCEKLQTLLVDLNTKRDDFKQRYKLEVQRFDFHIKAGRDNIRYLALVSGSVIEVAQYICLVLSMSSVECLIKIYGLEPG